MGSDITTTFGVSFISLSEKFLMTINTEEDLKPSFSITFEKDH